MVFTNTNHELLYNWKHEKYNHGHIQQFFFKLATCQLGDDVDMRQAQRFT